MGRIGELEGGSVRPPPPSVPVARAPQPRSSSPAPVVSRGKEAEVIDVPPLPTAAGRDAWVVKVEQAVVCASGRDDPEVVQEWIAECRFCDKNPDVVFGPEATPRPLRCLDRKLGAAITKVIDAAGASAQGLATGVDVLQAARAHDGKLPHGGRRLLHEVVCYYGLNKANDTQRNIYALYGLEWPGDANLVAFAGHLHKTAAGAARGGMDLDIVSLCCWKLVKKSKVLATKVAAFEENHRGEDRRWEDAVLLMNEFIDEKRVEAMENQYTQEKQAELSKVKGSKPAGGAPAKHPPPPPPPAARRVPPVQAKAPPRGRGRVGSENGGPDRQSDGSAPPPDDSPRGSGAGSQEEIKWCKYLSSGGRCHIGDACIFRHADTAADMARMKEALARRRAQGQRQRPPPSAPAVYTSGVLRRWGQDSSWPRDARWGQSSTGVVNDAWTQWQGGDSGGSEVEDVQ